MGRQSARVFFQGKDHKDIYFNGHYHDSMYQGSTLIWEKCKKTGWVKYETAQPGMCSGNGVILSANGVYIYRSTDGISWEKTGELDSSFLGLPLNKGETKIIFLNGCFYIFCISFYTSSAAYSSGTIFYKTYDGEKIEKMKIMYEWKKNQYTEITNGGISYPTKVFSNEKEIIIVEKNPSRDPLVYGSTDGIRWSKKNAIETEDADLWDWGTTCSPKDSGNRENLIYEDGFWYFVGRVYAYEGWKKTEKNGKFWRTKSFAEYEEVEMNHTKIDSTNWQGANCIPLRRVWLGGETYKYNLVGEEWEEYHKIFGISQIEGKSIIGSGVDGFSCGKKVFPMRAVMEDKTTKKGLIYVENNIKKGEFYETAADCKSVLQYQGNYYVYAKNKKGNYDVYIRKE